MSFCFEEGITAIKRDIITEEEYLSLILSHFKGVRHPDDSNERNLNVDLSSSRPYAESVRHAALDTEYEPLKDTKFEEKLFQACMTGQIDEVKSHLDNAANGKSMLSLMLQPLTTLAAERGHPTILKECLSRGAHFDRNLDRAIELGFYKHSDMLRVLADAKWRNIQDAKHTLNDQDTINRIVRPWLQEKKAPEMMYLEEKESYKERHERLIKTGKHPPGTCKTGKELEERFGWIDW